MPKLPCFLCGKDLQQRTDKNKKPYFVCDPCGTQIFIRRPQGIENLSQLIRTIKGRDLPLREHAHTLFQIRAILQEIEGVKSEMKKLRLKSLIFDDADKEKKRAHEILEQRLQKLLAELESVTGAEASS